MVAGVTWAVGSGVGEARKGSTAITGRGSRLGRARATSPRQAQAKMSSMLTNNRTVCRAVSGGVGDGVTGVAGGGFPGWAGTRPGATGSRLPQYWHCVEWSGKA